VPKIDPVFQISNIEGIIKQNELKMVWESFDVKGLKPPEPFFLQSFRKSDILSKEK
jgi:hypothetical protein